MGPEKAIIGAEGLLDERRYELLVQPPHVDSRFVEAGLIHKVHLAG